MNFNRIILAGRLTADPESKELPSGTTLAKFRLASNETWTDRDGQKQEDTCYVDVDAFGRRGEIVMEYFSKGKPILVEGKLKFSQWDDDNGNSHSKHSILMDDFSFISTRNGESDDTDQDDGDHLPF